MAISGLEKPRRICYHRLVQEAIGKNNIQFMELATGSPSRFIFSLSLALAAVITKSPAYLDLLLAFAIMAILSWGGHIKDIAKVAFYIVLPLAFVVILHLYSHNGKPLFKVWFLTATAEGLKAGIFYGLKLIVFAYAGAIIFITIDPFDLISPIERFARSTGRLGRPLGALALSFFLALRFLPDLGRQSRLTILAYKTRGLDMKGGLLHKARIASLLIAPMFVNGFKRAELAAGALNAKGYATRYSRAVLRPIRITLGSVITIFISIVILFAGWRA